MDRRRTHRIVPPEQERRHTPNVDRREPRCGWCGYELDRSHAHGCPVWRAAMADERATPPRTDQ